MFAKKQSIDVKKSIQKILDIKKDPFSRLKHLKQCLELHAFDAKKFFETNYSHIYYIFFETISNLDITFKQKSQKQSKEEQDVCLFIFEKILIYLPEILNKGWQQHSIGFLLQRLLHHQNSIAIRKEGVRLFLIWYQILNLNAKQNVHHMFASLIPGIASEIPNPFIQTTNNQLNQQIPLIPNIQQDQLSERIKLTQTNDNHQSNTILTTNLSNLSNQQVYNLNYTNVPPGNFLINNNPIFAAEIEPMIPSFNFEVPPKDYTIFYLQHVLNFMVNQVHKIQWTENREQKHRQCFRFLFEQFNKIYLKNIFNELDDKFSFYEPILVLPSPRIISLDEKINFNNKRFQHSNTILDCKSRIILWFTKFMKSNLIEIVKKDKSDSRTNGNEFLNKSNEHQNDFSRELKSSLNSQLIEPTQNELDLVYSYLTSTRDNVNLAHQILNQAFLMPFWQSETMREVVSVYREWIYKSYNQVPIFLDEPKTIDNQQQSNNLVKEDVRAGLSSFHRIFITYSANVFLLQGVPIKKSFLVEQVEMCKRVLNVYRYMVMKVEMDKKTWEQLLLVVLRITSLVLTEQLPIKKEDTLGGRLAPAFFETLIVTWIKANLNIFVNIELWERFQTTLKSLTNWEELVKEWARTMDTLTRVMSRYVYNINLYDLPLERPINRKNKRQVSRGKTVGQVNFNPKLHETSNNDDSNSTTTNHQHQQKQLLNKQNESQQNQFNESTESRESNKSSESNLIVNNNNLNNNKLVSDNNQPKKSSSNKIFHKSFSDSSLIKIRREEYKKILKSRENDEFKSYMENFHDLEHDEEMKHFHDNNKSNYYLKPNLKSKSLINLSAFNIHNQNDLDSDVHSLNHSRSPSPISCNTNLETNNSLKETLNLDGLSIATSNHQHQQQQHHYSKEDQHMNRSVITGGTYKNWSPDSAVILWRRMLGILGDINEFNNPHLHLLAIHCLAKIVDDFIKIRDNLGVLIDQNGNFQQNPDYFPTHVPPLDYFVSWLFEATYLNDNFKQGKLIAYRLLCIIATKKHETLLESNEFLPMLYHTIHNGLNSCDIEIISVIIKSCKARLFSFSLPGSSILLYDFTEAAKLIIHSNENKEIPRFEALSLLGTLIGMNEIYSQLNSLQSTELNPTLTLNRNHNQFILELLIRAAKKEPTSLGRSMALNALGIYLYQQLSLAKDNLDNQFLSIINVLIGCTKFTNRILSRNACDIIRLQIDFTEFILKRYPKVISIIIDGLISSIRYHVDLAERQNSFKEYQNLLLSLLICLCEWCLSVPKDYLKLTQSISNPTESVLNSVLKLLNDLSSYNLNNTTINAMLNNQQQSSFIFKKCFEDNEIDYTIEIDNLIENTNLKRDQFANNNRFNDVQKTSNPDFTNSTINSTINSNKQSNVDDLAVIWMASSMLLNHLLNFIDNFPLAKLGASRLSCYLNEYDDNPYLIKNVDQTELNIDIFNAPNIIYFIVNNSSIISFIDLSNLQQQQSSASVNKKSIINEKGKIRFIVRDLTGKFAWTCSNVHSINKNTIDNLKSVEKNFETNLNFLDDDDLNQQEEQRPDPLDLLLQQLNETSPECLSLSINSNQLNQQQHHQRRLSTHSNKSNQSIKSNNQQTQQNQIEQSEENMMALLVNQHYQEMNYAERLSESQSILNLNKQNALNYQEKIEKCFEVNNVPTEFLNCRQFIDQIGFLNWDKRTKIELLAKNERVLRELRNLDKQKTRETHKIAVIYVKEGQEDKNSILSNQCGSKEFEQFVSSLGWEVDLQNHLGFRGGLADNLSTGKTAPYFANSFYEVMFHVSTRIPSTNSNDEDQNFATECINKKLRHLGNDEVHIIWSEHYRSYRRGIIPTEFCDVLIVIYPIIAYPGYYRITISRKNGIPFFGPLYNEAVVHLSVLGGLVRATAINASRAQRSQVPFYKNYFEERNEALQNIFKQHKELTSFESFASTIYLPKQQQVTGNGFFQNQNILQYQPQQISPILNNSNGSNSSKNSLINKLNNKQQQSDLNRKFEPIIRNEFLERPKLIHQNSEPLIRKNQRSQSMSQFKVNNSGPELIHRPMVEK